MSKERLEAMAGGQLKDVVPIKGSVTVDGEPAEGVNLYLFREKDPINPVMECRTDENGDYCWSSYLNCDGVAPGKYLVGFAHILNPKKNDSGVDLLKGKYRNPQRNKIELVVEEGVEQEDVVYELKTN
jgi:hypothetical protein